MHFKKQILFRIFYTLKEWNQLAEHFAEYEISEKRTHQSERHTKNSKQQIRNGEIK